MLKTDNDGRIRINVPISHGDYPLEQHFKKTYEGTAFDCDLMGNVLGHDVMVQIVEDMLNQMPITAQHIQDAYGEDHYVFALDTFSGTPEEFHDEAEAYLDYFLPIVYESGGDGTHFDEIPSATEEFILICKHTGCADLIQKLYDSLWQEGNAYHPLSEDSDDPGLHGYFENIEGVTLHLDHPLVPLGS